MNKTVFTKNFYLLHLIIGAYCTLYSSCYIIYSWATSNSVFVINWGSSILITIWISLLMSFYIFSYLYLGNPLISKRLLNSKFLGLILIILIPLLTSIAIYSLIIIHLSYFVSFIYTSILICVSSIIVTTIIEKN